MTKNSYATKCFLILFSLMAPRLCSAEMPPQTVDRTTLTGKVMCGYQGWFACPDDGLGRGWYHWGRGSKFDPDHCTIDLWPDVSELDTDEKHVTAFVHKDEKPACVFSSQNPKTVDRHFLWMQQYGIDGAFVQRFASEVTAGPLQYRQFTTVLENANRGANAHGRTYALMYDLSGMQQGQLYKVQNDLNQLLEEQVILGDDDEAYLYHHGKPVVSVWGIGFSDNRPYTLEECAVLVEFLKTHPKSPGGNGFTVMLGVPTYWREMKWDAINDPKLHEIIQNADIISPWSVGRYANIRTMKKLAESVWADDLAWCKEAGKEYLPVVFPGFSWHNLKPDRPLDEIPRQGGRFLWAQYRAVEKIGATMVYQAMFDEVDEGTAIFKCTNDPPVNGTFLTYKGLPSDHYLWLTGMGGRLIRKEIEPDEELPQRK